MEFQLIKGTDGPDTTFTNDAIAEFLFVHLDEYGDKKEFILKCLDYVFDPNRGGHVLVGHENGEITGAVVINYTRMGGYIPENILVYIAVHQQHRGKGLGRQLMQEVLMHTEGDVALHVEADNPAKFLYEKVGFTNPYLEMRLKR